jgi:CDP-glucose 4,6-dehydratase
MPARRARLQWRPRLPLGEALGWTVEWYKRQLEGEAAGALVGEQIERYERAGTV